MIYVRGASLDGQPGRRRSPILLQLGTGAGVREFDIAIGFDSAVVLPADSNPCVAGVRVAVGRFWAAGPLAEVDVLLGQISVAVLAVIFAKQLAAGLERTPPRAVKIRAAPQKKRPPSLATSTSLSSGPAALTEVTMKGVRFTDCEKAFLGLASRHIRRLVCQLDEQKRAHREMLIERDMLNSTILRMTAGGQATSGPAELVSAMMRAGSERGRHALSAASRMQLFRLAPQRTELGPMSVTRSLLGSVRRQLIADRLARHDADGLPTGLPNLLAKV